VSIIVIHVAYSLMTSLCLRGVCVYVVAVIDTRYKIDHMPEKENTLYVEQKDQSAYAIYVNKVKSPDLVLGQGI
jgi:hypothetical protein